MIGLKEVRQAALFEKSAQKLLLLWDCGVGTPPHQIRTLSLFPRLMYDRIP
jgi:hypothetical protein